MSLPLKQTTKQFMTTLIIVSIRFRLEVVSKS
ncbi:Uncharacterised protein [Vibrio cholerae]|nr:Uncharacterised protein [Vibrio cholerae]